MLVKIGGGNHGVGIHGTHLGPGIRIRYGHTDEARQTIPWVEISDANTGLKTTYTAPGAKPDGSGTTLREMDCMDCHNRPSHSYQLPERAVDDALYNGAISPALPFAKKISLELVKKPYRNRAEAAVEIPAAFEKRYRESYPAAYAKLQGEVARSAKGVLAVYSRNVFPGHECYLGNLSEQRRPYGFPRLLSLS
jgi:hypothetical protein